ncbi:MAG TPA: hypothetical protein EYQ08_04680 [Planctomycetes bacterium]|nr:hypothetical protein [Planctomycetota bacterium]
MPSLPFTRVISSASCRLSFRPQRIRGFLCWCGVLIAIVIAGSGCSDDHASYDGVRSIEKAVHPILPGATASQRFGTDRPTRPLEPDPSVPTLAYDLPAGWIEAPLTAMRRINVRIAGSPDAECFLIVIPGGGTLRNNIDRWCGQMDQPNLSDDALDNLPKATLLEREGVLFQIDGTFTDGFASKTVPDARMIVYSLPLGDTTLYLKATGPRTLLMEQAEALVAFASSIRLEIPQAPPPERNVPSIRWQAPQDWEVDVARPMREVTFIVGEEARCWITVLAGDGGGALANVNRWLKELSLEPIDDQQLSKLPTETMLGGQAIVVEGSGPYASMGSTPRQGWSMIGLIRNLADRAVFVKMVGPDSELKEARSKLKQLVLSLEVVQ